MPVKKEGKKSNYNSENINMAETDFSTDTEDENEHRIGQPVQLKEELEKYALESREHRLTATLEAHMTPEFDRTFPWKHITKHQTKEAYAETCTEYKKNSNKYVIHKFLKNNKQKIIAQLRHTEHPDIEISIPWCKLKKGTSRTIPPQLDGDTSLSPDIIIFKGLAENENIPDQPTKDITIILVDIVYARDRDGIREATKKKTKKYKQLITKWEMQGWKVDKTIRVIAVGHYGGIPNLTHTNLQSIGIQHQTSTKTCKKISTIAARGIAQALLLGRTLEHTIPQYYQRSAVAQRIWSKRKQNKDKCDADKRPP